MHAHRAPLPASLRLAAAASARNLNILPETKPPNAAPHQDGETPLIAAASAGAAACVSALLALGASALAADKARSAVELESGAGASSLCGGVARALVPRLCSPLLSTASQGGRTALHLAADAASAEALLSAGCAPDAPDRELRTPLSVAAANGRDGAAAALLAAGADRDSRDGEGMTPLLWAAAAGEAACVRLLLSAGAERDATAQARPSLATLPRPSRASQAPLSRPHFPTSPFDSPQNGMSAVQLAAREGRVDCVEALAKAGADVNAVRTPSNPPRSTPVRPPPITTDGGTPHPSERGQTAGPSSALHLAAANGNAACVRALISAGAATDARDAHVSPHQPPPIPQNSNRSHSSAACRLRRTTARPSFSTATPLRPRAGRRDGDAQRRPEGVCGGGGGPRGGGRRRLRPGRGAPTPAYLRPALALRCPQHAARREADLIRPPPSPTNTPPQRGNTPLHVSCARGHAGCADALIRAGADKEAADGVRSFLLAAVCFSFRAPLDSAIGLS